MVKRNITIYDVAKEAGVSLATVSRVINGSSVVKADTREKVLEVIQRLDFKPNQIARGLATSKTTTIAIIFPQSLFAHVKDMIGGIGDTSRTLDYSVTIYTSDELGNGDPIKDVIEKVIKSRADGVILFNNDDVDYQIDLLNKYNIPVVVIGKKVNNDNNGSIYADSKQFVFELADKYLSQGKKDICFVSALQNLLSIESMIEGLKEAYSQHGLVFDVEKQVLSTSNHYEESYPQFKEYFSTHKHDVVIAGYDKEAVAVVNAALDNGISIPSQMEVVGMMNTSYAQICRPALTSIYVPVYDMGALAVRLLTKMLNNEIENKNICVTHSLMPRETTL